MVTTNKKLSDLHLFCDIDGTLGIAGQGIPQRNKQAIARFIEKGGKFSLCTGRWTSNILHFVEDLPINAPSVVGNGCAIYDFNKGQYLAKQALPKEAKGYLQQVMADCPQLGFMVVNEEGYFLLGNEDQWKGHEEDQPKHPFKPLEELKEPFYKFMFFTRPALLLDLLKQLEQYQFQGVRLVPSVAHGIELIPENVNKSAAFLQICNDNNIDIANTVFMGDFYNDREIFAEAGFSACPAETPDDLKEICDAVFGNCMDGAVADLIEYLESVCE